MKTLINKFTKNHLHFSLLIVIFTMFFWDRFIRLRLPKNIPFDFTFFRFLILICICSITAYALYRNFVKPKVNPLLLAVISKLRPILLPIKDTHDSLILNYYLKTPLYFLLKFLLVPIRTQRFLDDDYRYLIIFILPKTIFILCLVIDCFHFKQLNLIYNCSVIMLFPLVVIYLNYCGKLFMNQTIPLLEHDFLTNMIMLEDFPDLPEDEIKYFYNFLNSPNSITYDDYPDGFSFSEISFMLAVREKLEKFYYLEISKMLFYQTQALTLYSRLYEFNLLFQKDRKDFNSGEKQELFIQQHKNLKTNFTLLEAKMLIEFFADLNAFNDGLEMIKERKYKSIYPSNCIIIDENTKIDLPKKDRTIFQLYKNILIREFNKPRIYEILFNLLSLTCWLYILIISIRHLPETKVMAIIESLCSFNSYFAEQMIMMFL